MNISKEVLARFPYGLISEIVEDYKLHTGGSGPVNLAPLYDALNIRIYQDIILPDGIKAFSTYHPRRGHGVAAFQAGLDEPSLAHAMGHEMGHLLSQEFGRMHGCVTSPGGMVQQEEQEADLVASYLLVPGHAFYQMCRADYTLDEIAVTFNVPVRLLEYRAQLMIAHDEFGVASDPPYQGEL